MQKQTPAAASPQQQMGGKWASRERALATRIIQPQHEVQSASLRYRFSHLQA